ncbi:MAG: PorT family protein [Flavobacteriaceae bacterium]|nr:PorT family protein [Flavobacteriaceae bacterium]
MRKLFLALTIICGAYFTGHAQFGVKGGLNFNSNGDLTEIISQTVTNVTNPDTKIGYHIGAFYQSKGNSFYVRPELIYTKTKSDYNGADFDMSKLDMPVLVGYKIIKPLSIFAGPAFQYILNTDLDGVNLNDVKNDFTIGVNIGAAVEFGKFGIDVRYEKGLSENLANFTGVNVNRLDTRPNQFVVSMSLKL